MCSESPSLQEESIVWLTDRRDFKFLREIHFDSINSRSRKPNMSCTDAKLVAYSIAKRGSGERVYYGCVLYSRRCWGYRVRTGANDETANYYPTEAVSVESIAAGRRSYFYNRPDLYAPNNYLIEARSTVGDGSRK